MSLESGTKSALETPVTPEIRRLASLFSLATEKVLEVLPRGTKKTDSAWLVQKDKFAEQLKNEIERLTSVLKQNPGGRPGNSVEVGNLGRIIDLAIKMTLPNLPLNRELLELARNKLIIK